MRKLLSQGRLVTHYFNFGKLLAPEVNSDVFSVTFFANCFIFVSMYLFVNKLVTALFKGVFREQQRYITLLKDI